MHPSLHPGLQTRGKREGEGESGRDEIVNCYIQHKIVPLTDEGRRKMGKCIKMQESVIFLTVEYTANNVRNPIIRLLKSVYYSVNC